MSSPCSQAHDINLNLPELENFPIQRMVHITQVALSISPLTLLCPKKVFGESYDRAALLQASIAEYFSYQHI
jgi:hypothetical protein